MGSNSSSHCRGVCGWYAFMIHTRYHPSATNMLRKFYNNGLPTIFSTATWVHLIHCSTRCTTCSNSNVCKGSHFLASWDNSPQVLELDSLHDSYPSSFGLCCQYVAISNLFASRTHHPFLLTMKTANDTKKLIINQLTSSFCATIMTLFFHPSRNLVVFFLWGFTFSVMGIH